jgi:hypothetical protein
MNVIYKKIDVIDEEMTTNCWEMGFVDGEMVVGTRMTQIERILIFILFS